MQYDIELDQRYARFIRKIFLTGSIPYITVTLLALAVIMVALSPEPETALIVASSIILVGLPVGVSLMLIYASFYVRLIKKAYGDADGKVIWTYKIERDTITISIGDKTKLEYEKSGLKKVKTHKEYIKFGHKRLAFWLPLPADKGQQVIDALKEYGWLTK